MSKRKQTCGNCRYWACCGGLTSENSGDIGTPGDRGDAHGYCHRYPPQFTPGYYNKEPFDRHPMNMLNWNLPVMLGCSWCGEWQPVEQEGKTA